MSSNTFSILNEKDSLRLINSIKLPNKQFAQEISYILSSYPILSEEDLSNISDQSFCKKEFSSDYPMIKPVTGSAEDIRKQTSDGAGNIRFYQNVFSIRGKQYVFNSQLYGYKEAVSHKDNRTPFYKWILNRYNVSEPSWWPPQEEYDLKLTKDDWITYITEVEMPNYPSPMKMLKGMMDLGGEASCKELADNYGGTSAVYIGCATNLGRRVKNYFDLPTCMDGDQERFFPFPFLGKNDPVTGNYIYKIRDELLAALNEVDISNVNPYYSRDDRMGKFDSWEIVDEKTAIKHCDPSFFKYNSSGVPKGICWFFEAEDLNKSESKEINLFHNSINYVGKITNDSTDRRRIQISWNNDLGRLFKEFEDNDCYAIFNKLEPDKYIVNMKVGESVQGTVLEKVIKALENIGGKGSYAQIYESYEELTNQPLTSNNKATIRGTIERNSSDSDAFTGNDVFYSVEGKGRGIWGLRSFNREMTIKETINHIKSYISSKGFTYEDDLIENFYLSLKSKPFVILAGTSGTGKTRLVKLFAEAISAKMELVPVRPDWSDSSDLFGHNDISDYFHPGAIIDFIKEANENKNIPYVLCLDEMNLARVEYYLSDFLSIIETRDRKNGEIITDLLIKSTYFKNQEAEEKYGQLHLPENLYIIGTVNMDETTFPFSKKVLDRANTIEFSFVNLMSINSTDEEFSKLTLNNDFLKTEYLYLKDCDNDELVNNVCFTLEEINQILLKANLHVGYRVRDEICFYMMNNKKSELLDEDIALDHEIMQKILPRIQGSSAAIKDALSEMFIKCAGDYTVFNGLSTFEQMNAFIDSDKDCKYPNSAKKIAFMMRRYEEDGFTSYWL